MINLEDLKEKSENIDINEYLKFYKYVRDNMQHPEWLSEFNMEELVYILDHDGKIFNYYNNDILVSSIMYIPSNNKSLRKHNIKYDEEIVGSCGPVLVNPKYVGNGLQLKMMIMLDEYSKSLNKKYMFTKAHPDNIYSIKNILKDGYEFIEDYMSSDGPKRCYIKKL